VGAFHQSFPDPRPAKKPHASAAFSHVGNAPDLGVKVTAEQAVLRVAFGPLDHARQRRFGVANFSNL
jgi:hypothetical protein